jgi:hypothetical protein
MASTKVHGTLCAVTSKDGSSAPCCSSNTCCVDPEGCTLQETFTAVGFTLQETFTEGCALAVLKSMLKLAFGAIR